MIDLHCHILPGLDDGPVKLDQALAMARVAADDGVTHVVATPHHRPPAYVVSRRDVEREVVLFNRRLDEAGIALEVLPGAEVALRPELAAEARRGGVTCLGWQGRYFCLELGEAGAPEGLKDLVFQLRLQGLTPIITHPERLVDRDWEWLAELVELGCLGQVTAMALTGRMGRPQRKAARELLQQGLAHLVASDGHGPERRPPLLGQARREVEQMAGPDMARQVFVDRPQAVLEGRDLDLAKPLKRRRWLSAWLG